MHRLTDLLAAIRRFYDPEREPLRRHVYTTLTGIAALAVVAGVITGSAAAAVVGPLAAVLAVPAVESARSRVTPDAAYGRHARKESTS